MDGLDTAARRSSARQRALLALNGAAVAALLLSAAMYASDRVALASAVQAKAHQCSLVSSWLAARSWGASKCAIRHVGPAMKVV